MSIFLYIRNKIAETNGSSEIKMGLSKNSIFEPKIETTLGEFIKQLCYVCILPLEVKMIAVLKLLAKIPAIKIS